MRSFLNFLLAVPAVLAAPVVHQVRAEDVIAGSWIVSVRENALMDSVLSTVRTLTGVRETHRFEIGSFRGFSMDNVGDLVSLLSALPSIAAIEPNGRVYASALVTQQNAPWGLARISHRNAGATSYIYDDSAGQGTFSYIIDTGIFTEHNDFGGRAVKGANFVPDEDDFDGNGHGTHCAGTTGSNTFGVAKKTTLVAVKVLSSEGSGTIAQVLAGMDWAVNDAKSKGRIGKAVANLSLGGLFSPMTNRAAAAAVDEGLFLAIAAGNSGLPALTASPASEPSVCTVGATDRNDARASFSNFGLLVDIFAPGVNVTSTWNRGPDDTLTISGTSMAAPHVAGLGAYLLSLEGARSPAELCSRIQTLSTKDSIKLPLSRNRLAYNGNGA